MNITGIKRTLHQSGLDTSKPRRVTRIRRNPLEIEDLLRHILEYAGTAKASLVSREFRWVNESIALQNCWSRIKKAVLKSLEEDPEKSSVEQTINAISDSATSTIRSWLKTNRDILNLVEDLDLSKTDISIIPKELDLFRKLKFLDLSENMLSSIPTGIFSFTLEELRLGDNQFESFPEFATGEYDHLEILDLTRNKLTSIPENAFFYFPMLWVIDLRENQIQSIDKYALSDVKHLEELHLSDNQISDLEFLGCHSSVFRELDLSRNKLISIPSGVFSENPEGVRSLNFKENQIQSIDPDAFSGLDLLERLDLSSNQISDLEFLPNSDFPHLSFIDLSHNQITTIKRGTFCPPAQNEICLDDNPIHTVENGAFLATSNLRISGILRDLFERFLIRGSIHSEEAL